MMASTMLAIAAHVFTAVLPGFQIANGSFTLNGVPTRLFAGSLQHFRIHPDHWEHRLATAKAMGLNAVQTLTPWMMMEPSPGEFISTGILDIVRFSKLAHAAGLLVVLRPGPFICDGPDFGGLPWWLSQQNNPDLLVPGERPTSQLRVRTADPAFLRRVDIFTTKLFALLRTNNLTADLGGPIVMAQIENEYGLFGSDYAYLEHLRDTWRAGLGPGVVIHSTDPPTSKVLGGSRIPGVLQTIDFGYTSDPAGPFAELKASQAMVNTEPQPLMCSEIYPGTLTYWGDSTFPVIYPPTLVAASIDKILDTEHCGGSTSFALWLFAACTDFGWWGGVLELWSGASAWRALVPTYDFGAPVDESGVVRPLFYLLQDVLRKHGAVIPEGGLPPPPPCRGYGAVTMTESLLLWDALPSLLATTALTPGGTPIASATVRTMEEIGQGYGLILYSAPIVPSQVAAGRVETVVSIPTTRILARRRSTCSTTSRASALCAAIESRLSSSRTSTTKGRWSLIGRASALSRSALMTTTTRWMRWMRRAREARRRSGATRCLSRTRSRTSSTSSSRCAGRGARRRSQWRSSSARTGGGGGRRSSRTRTTARTAIMAIMAGRKMGTRPRRTMVVPRARATPRRTTATATTAATRNCDGGRERGGRNHKKHTDSLHQTQPRQEGEGGEGRCVPLPTHSAATVLSARIFYADALPPWLRYDSSWS